MESSLWEISCGIFVVESSFLNSCRGIGVVFLLWNMYCGISAVECLLWNTCCRIVVVEDVWRHLRC